MQDMRRRIDRGDINLEIDETIQVCSLRVVKCLASMLKGYYDVCTRLCVILQRIEPESFSPNKKGFPFYGFFVDHKIVYISTYQIQMPI